MPGCVVYLFVGEPQAAGEPCSERDPECALGVCRGNSTRFYTRYKFFIGHQSFCRSEYKTANNKTEKHKTAKIKQRKHTAKIQNSEKKKKYRTAKTKQQKYRTAKTIQLTYNTAKTKQQKYKTAITNSKQSMSTIYLYL